MPKNNIEALTAVCDNWNARFAFMSDAKTAMRSDAAISASKRPSRGSVILLHGDPGSKKTTTARKWKSIPT